MPPLALLVPIAVPIAAGLVAALAGRTGDGIPRAAAVVGAWAAAAAVVALWLPVRATEELSIGQLGFGTTLELRLDAASVIFALLISIPVAALLTMQPRSWQESAVASLMLAAALLAIEAGGVLLTAVAGCTAATLAVTQLGIEDEAASRPSWAMLFAAWLALAWAGVILQVRGGTAVYAAVPVSALTPPVWALIAFAAVVGAGLYPWRGWAARLWLRPRAGAAGLVAATLPPLALYLLVRAYDMGDGHYPQSWLNAVLALWGVLVAAGAAARAQAAPTRREYMAEVLQGLAGFALFAIAVGSALGFVAALILLASAAVIAVCLTLTREGSGTPTLLVTAAAAGLPPGLAFGGRLLGLDAAFEAGEAIGLVGLAAAATWLLSAAAAARSVGLPSGDGGETTRAGRLVAGVLAGIALAAGPALGFAYLAGVVAAADVMSTPAAGFASAPASIVTVSTVLPAIALLGPLLVAGAVAVAMSRPAPSVGVSAARAPLFRLWFTETASRAWSAVRAASVPAEYRSLVNLRALEAAAAGGTPALWLFALVVLALAVTR